MKMWIGSHFRWTDEGSKDTKVFNVSLRFLENLKVSYFIPNFNFSQKSVLKYSFLYNEVL